EAARLGPCENCARGPSGRRHPRRAKRGDRRNVTCSAASRRSHQLAVGRVNAISGAVAPEQIDACIELDRGGWMQRERGLDVEEVAWAEAGLFTEIVAARVHRIEAAEAPIGRITVTARDRCQPCKPRPPCAFIECVPGLGG